MPRLTISAVQSDAAKHGLYQLQVMCGTCAEPAHRRFKLSHLLQCSQIWAMPTAALTPHVPAAYLGRKTTSRL